MSSAKGQNFYRLYSSGPQWGGVTPIEQANPWLLSALRKVADLAELPEGWDSYGSRQIQQAAIERVSDVLNTLSCLNLPLPQIFPVPGGGIQIELRQDGRELEIEILPDGSIEYLLVLADGEMSEGAIPPASQGELLRLVFKLQGKQSAAFSYS